MDTSRKIPPSRSLSYSEETTHNHHQQDDPKKRGFVHRISIRAKLAILFYLVTLTALITIGSYGYYHANQIYLKNAMEESFALTHEISERIQWKLTTSAGNAQFIAHLYAMIRYAYWRDIGDAEQIAYWRDITNDILCNYAEANADIFKIRLIDTHGQEQLLVQKEISTGKSRIVPENELQNLSNQSFFRELGTVEKNSILISSLVPNRDHDEIVRPILSVFHTASPLFGSNGERYGTIVVTRLASGLSDTLRKANQNPLGRMVYLLNKEGEYLFHPNPDRIFGRLLGQDSTFSFDFPDEFKQITANTQGWSRSAGQMLTFTTIEPNHRHDDTVWKLVSMIPEDRVFAEMNHFILVFLLLSAGVVAGTLFAARYVIAQIMRPLQFVTDQLEQLERGEPTPQTLHYTARDEVGRMLDSTQRVVENLQRLARQADAIANGDLSSEVQPVSERDRLGRSIQHMTAILRSNHATTVKENWQKDGLAQLTHLLTGSLDPPRLANLALSQVGRYLEVGRGVLYAWNPTDERLDLIGSFMYTERATLGARVRLGEGAIGQVAREKQPIVIHVGSVGSDPPPPAITTGSLHLAACHTYTWPLLHEGVLYGVLEVATLERLEEPQVDYLRAAADTIASFFLTAVQHKRIQDLLTSSDALAKAAQAQSLQLQETNEQMKEQQWRLQQQAEELQQTNAQMEEQQQQLQQQSEELRQANAQLEEQQQQLYQQATALENRNRILEQASRYKSDFLANMSHELRTPLNSIILLSKILTLNDTGHLNAEDLKRAKVIYQAGTELLRLIDDILDLSKVEAGHMEVHFGQVASQSLVLDFQRQFEETAHVKGLTFLCEDRFQGSFTTDPDRVCQIVRNLLSNAFKFTSKGRVALTVARQQDRAYPIALSVTDSGIGIAHDKIGLIFDTFRQADDSISRQFGGTGLGLSISRRLAELLGGTLRVESTVGVGSTFTLSLPENTSFSPTESQKQKVMTTPGKDQEVLAPGEEAILLIDDDPAFRAAVTHLNHQQGYKTLVATTAAEGLSLARIHRPSGILLDLGLPDMDGTELLKILKSDRVLRSVPVYIVSARDRDSSLSQDIVGYLRKPLNDQQILSAEAKLFAQVAQVPRLLVVEEAGITAEWIRQRLPTVAVEVYRVPEDSEACAPPLPMVPHGLALVGLDANDDLVRCEFLCKHLRQSFPDMPLLIYSQRAISHEEESVLRRYTDTIVIRTHQAERRLLENIDRFLREVRSPDQNAWDIVPASTREHRLAGRRALVVDDDPRNLFVVTSALEREGAVVQNALDGRKAIEWLQSVCKTTRVGERPVDIVFMDIMMPNMSGYEAIAVLKSDPLLRTIPIVALTAKAMKTDRDETVMAGADDYLAKPVDYEILINMAELWCSRRIE